MACILNASTSSGLITSADTSGELQFQSNGVQIGTLCRAWVNFNGTGTVAIRASFNVSSITDNGTGDYTVNFTTAMPDANYSSVGSAANIAGAYSAITFNSNSSGAASVTAPTTSQFRFTVTNSSVGVVDSTYVNVAIFR